ncbi:MAG: helix-turn-helix domain-containing protein [Rhizobiales bacterium]|nr:helix-turn-helix domain-containing protein [Hyphomicrobiales bacterium]
MQRSTHFSRQGQTWDGQTWDAPFLLYLILWPVIPRIALSDHKGRDLSAEPAFRTMTETPPSFAGTPDRAAAAMAGPDALSQMLRAVRLTGSVFFGGYFTAPFGVISPKHWDESTALARLRHISVFHLIAAGRCTFEHANGERREIMAGDILLLPFAGEHRFWNGTPPEFAFAPDIVRPGPIEGVDTLNYGGGGEETRIICGYLESSEFLFTPVFRTLPQMLVEKTSNEKVGALMASTVREIASLVEAATPGTQTILGRMMELLFVEVLRRHVSRLPSGSKGWFAALNDPIVGRALALVHADPARKWTADDLARAAGSSRTVLAERFNALLGRPPIDYVTSWRIQLAADRLRHGTDTIAGIAADVGYESEAAFSRAFKRETGLTPGRWRNGGDADSHLRG